MKKIFYWIGAIILFIICFLVVSLGIFITYQDLGGSFRTGGVIFGVPLMVVSIFFFISGIFYISFARGKRIINWASNTSLILLLVLIIFSFLSFFVLQNFSPASDALEGLGLLLITGAIFLILSLISFISIIIGFIMGKKQEVNLQPKL